MARWPDLRSDIPVEAAINLGVAAALSAGLCVDIDEIGAPSVVIADHRPSRPLHDQSVARAASRRYPVRSGRRRFSASETATITSAR